MEKLTKEFKPTSWSIDNKISIYVLAIIIAVFGLKSYNSLPKEQFPELVIPTMIVTTVYAGTSPTDMENLVTRIIEKQIKSINGVKKVSSNSIQDFSSIVVEFNTNVNEDIAKQKVKDAVDKAKKDLPNNLTREPEVMNIDFSEIPIMAVNLFGDVELDKLKKYADMVKDRIEGLPEVTRVDIVGALDREIQIDVDMYKLQAAGLTFSNVEQAVAYENITMSGGSIKMYGMERSIRVVGEYKSVKPMEEIVLHSSTGGTLKLKDVATVKDAYKDRESYARLDGKNVITLNIIKKSGRNLLDASDKSKEILTDLKKTKFPEKLSYSISADQSVRTRTMLDDLNNTIIIGFILVALILTFFMGFTNAFFIGLSVPLSMFLAYIVMPGIGFTLNMLVMFSFIFALGIVVDDAIVVIENTHRVFKQGHMTINQAAKFAAGEVFMPILSGTLTTLAPFFPLAFWPGTIGKFMFFIPITLIITLFASLLVAYIINPVFAVDFMKHEEENKGLEPRKVFIRSGIIGFFALIFYLTKSFGLGNFTVFIGIVYALYELWIFEKVIINFQHRFIPAMMSGYEKILRAVLHKNRPWYILWSMVGLLFFTFYLVGVVKPKVVLFPASDPQYIYAYIKMPIGTSIEVTDSVCNIVEHRIRGVVGENNPVVESIIGNVAMNASDQQFDNGSKVAERAKVSVAFVDFAKRNGVSTSKYLEEFRKAVKGIPGAEITVDQNQSGPPVGKPINIEVAGDDFGELVLTTSRLKAYLDSLQIPGIENLKSDFEVGKPEITIDIDRECANREGISTAQVGMEIRTAVLGKEISKYREGEDQYPIQLRFDHITRTNINGLLDTKITYRDMASGMFRQIPLSSVAKISYNYTYGSIKRLNVKRVITVSSNVLTGYTANDIVAKIQKALPAFPKSENVDIKLTGEQDSQKETSEFLGTAMMLALFLIFFILITQFNSLAKPFLIIIEVVFSIIGVLLGYMLTGMSISIIMTGIGVIALAGIVVRNGILLVEFMDVLKAQGLTAREAIIHGGKTRITPVILTASATILGLIPLAVGLNIDFFALFTELNPHIHFGGDNVAFFGPLAWAIIFGLSFATILTLLLVPIMYYIFYVGKIKSARRRIRRKLRFSF